MTPGQSTIPVRQLPTIYLVGFPASGKTTAGKRLKTLLNRPHYDLDREIEKTTLLTIPQIFEQHGEESFRKREAQQLRNTLYQNTILSTGGGTPLFHDNMNYMLSTGVVIYLSLPVEDLISRLVKSATKRPLFDGLSGEKLRVKVREMYDLRNPVYSKAHIQYSAKNLRSRPLDVLKELINEYLNQNF